MITPNINEIYLFAKQIISSSNLMFIPNRVTIDVYGYPIWELTARVEDFILCLPPQYIVLWSAWEMYGLFFV